MITSSRLQSHAQAPERGRKGIWVRFPTRFALGMTMSIEIYQRTLSPLLAPRCRFYPSCSEYAKLCLAKYSLPVAVARTFGRLARCHPFHAGGFDLP